MKTFIIVGHTEISKLGEAVRAAYPTGQHFELPPSTWLVKHNYHSANDIARQIGILDGKLGTQALVLSLEQWSGWGPKDLWQWIEAKNESVSESVSTVVPYQRDEFLTWLTYVNPGMLVQSNLALMNHSIRAMPDGGAVIEVGSFAGLSLNHIIHMMKQAGRSNSIFSMDEWQFENSDMSQFIPGSSVRFVDYRACVIDTFRRNLVLFQPDQLPHHIESSSDEFFRLWEAKVEATDFFGRAVRLGGPVSLAYIDGAHTYEQSWRDFENVDRFLLPGGFIIFDDSGDGSGWGSHRTAREASERPDYELVAKTPNYCIRKR
jgi:hypothetical protein